MKKIKKAKDPKVWSYAGWGGSKVVVKSPQNKISKLPLWLRVLLGLLMILGAAALLWFVAWGSA